MWMEFGSFEMQVVGLNGELGEVKIVWKALILKNLKFSPSCI